MHLSMRRIFECMPLPSSTSGRMRGLTFATRHIWHSLSPGRGDFLSSFDYNFAIVLTALLISNRLYPRAPPPCIVTFVALFARSLMCSHTPRGEVSSFFVLGPHFVPLPQFVLPLHHFPDKWFTNHPAALILERLITSAAQTSIQNSFNSHHHLLQHTF